GGSGSLFGVLGPHELDHAPVLLAEFDTFCSGDLQSHLFAPLVWVLEEPFVVDGHALAGVGGDRHGQPLCVDVVIGAPVLCAYRARAWPSRYPGCHDREGGCASRTIGT